MFFCYFSDTKFGKTMYLKNGIKSGKDVLFFHVFI